MPRRSFAAADYKAFSRHGRKRKGAVQHYNKYFRKFFGLGNGATPSGIEAVGEMKNNRKDICLFLVINAAGIQLIPSTVIAMRSELGASNPADILLPTWIVSLISLASALLIYFIYSKIYYGIQSAKQK